MVGIGEQVISVETPLMSGSYFVKITLKEKVIFRKVIRKL